MTVKSTVSFTDRHHQFASQNVEEGTCASVSSLVASAIEQMIQDKVERDMVLECMADTIKRRMETPRDQWPAINGDQDLFSTARECLLSK